MALLALYPCLDTASLTVEDSQFIVDTSHQYVDMSPIEGNHEHSDGHCSPFCMCHCCHTHIVIGELSLFSSFPTQVSLTGFDHHLQKDEWIMPFFRPPIYA